MAEREDYPVVHLFSPQQWHDQQVILCNERGRLALKRLLDTGETQLCFASDGEGFDLFLVGEEGTEEFPLPYLTSYAQERDRRTKFWLGRRVDGQKIANLEASLAAAEQRMAALAGMRLGQFSWEDDDGWHLGCQAMDAQMNTVAQVPTLDWVALADALRKDGEAK